MRTKTKTSRMDKAIVSCLNDDIVMWIKAEDIDMSVFAEYSNDQQGIAVYYADEFNSCAEPVFIRFYRSVNGMSIEPSTIQEYAEVKKSKLGHLLRRVNEV